jgi:hypothetical protein
MSLHPHSTQLTAPSIQHQYHQLAAAAAVATELVLAGPLAAARNNSNRMRK